MDTETKGTISLYFGAQCDRYHFIFTNKKLNTPLILACYSKYEKLNSIVFVVCLLFHVASGQDYTKYHTNARQTLIRKIETVYGC